MNSVKQKLYDLCLKYINERIETATTAIKLAQEAAEEDTKSSAGDKYETSREMLQQEIDRNQKQLAESRKLQHIVATINPEKNLETIAPGALVVTNNGNFYLSISLGQVQLNDESFFVISLSSPLGTKFKGLKTGDTFLFNQKEFNILNVI